MSGRPGRRMYGGGVSTGSQHDIRGRRKDRNTEELSKPDDDRDRGRGDPKGKPEEVRISKLTRLLARLDTEESFMTICGQIEGALNEVENQKYVYRCFQCLCPSFQEVFKGLLGLPWEADGTKRFAQLLLKICQSMENQKVKFFQWMVDMIMRTSRGSQTHVSSSAYVMESVSIQIIGNLEIEDAVQFVRCCYDVLEDVGNPRVFRVLGAIFVCGTNYTATSWRNPHFPDFIDMAVGWMVDVRQSHGQFGSCAELLEKSKLQFEKDLNFLITLMGQIIEDLEQSLKKVQPTSRSDSDEFKKVLQLAKAFACMAGLECPLDKLVLTEFCDRLVVATLQFIHMCEPHQNMDRKYRYELLSTVNKSLFYAGGVLSQSITKYFRAQLKSGTTNSGYVRLPKLFLASFLESITVWVEVAVSQTQLSEDISEICGMLLILMEDMLKRMPAHDQHYILNLVTALLRTRNVSLLQSSYTWLISKLPSSLDKPKSESVEDDEDCLFVLAGLSDMISNKSSSMLSLWALQPAVFEVLVKISNMQVHSRTQQCAMELLKMHCSMHSHFVSSIASTGSFNSDSPGTRFLPTLLQFWLDKLKILPDRQNQWLADWIFEFLQSTNSYSSLLYQVKPEFFHEFVKAITQSHGLLCKGAKIIGWICKDQGYSELELLNGTIRERVLLLVLDEKLPERIQCLYRNVMYNMQSILVIPENVFVEDCKETFVTYEKDEEALRTPALITTEFNQFLYELLVGSSPEIPKFISKRISSELTGSEGKFRLPIAADHLIRLKLKTPLGKPQDFFMQLLILLKRSRAARIPVPPWKLHFVFELEKKFQLWTYGSAVDDTELTEHIRQFYLMNKSPFLEWLKRIRLEVIESSLFSGEQALAYFNAALMGDALKMQHVLLQTNDRLGLKGMGNVAGFLYLEGRYEEALKLICDQDDPSSLLFNEIQDSTRKVLADAVFSLGKWSEKEDSKKVGVTIPINQYQYLNNLLDFQLTNKSKLDFSVIGDKDFLEHLKLPTLQKIHCWLQNTLKDNSFLKDSKLESLDRARMDKMIECGNMNYVRNWLVKKDANSILLDDDLSNLSLASVPVATLKVCADYCSKLGDNKKSVILYNILRELAAGSSMDSELANKVTINLCNKILESDEFFQIFSSESLSLCDRLETVKSLHEVTIHTFPDYAKAWLAYGDFAYSQHEKRNTEEPLQTEFMKYTAAECYTKYIQLSSQEKEDIDSSSTDALLNSHFAPYSPRLVVMARLLQLFRQGFHFDFETTIKSEDWLTLMAEIAQITEMRSFFIKKFPCQASLFFTSHDSKKSKNKFAVRRRNLFDLSPYNYVDTSDEPLSSNVLLSNLSQLEKISAAESNEKADPIMDTEFQHQFRSELELPTCASVFAEELLRLASSMEDMWVWSLERIAVDWGRRLTYLRKEWARAPSSDKNVSFHQAFVQPTVTYLEALLASTVASLSPVDMNFVNRHKSEIRRCLDLMSSSRTLDEVTAAMNSLMKYSERFGLLVNNKLPLTMFSPKLADPDFYQNDGFSLSLPGQSSHIKINSIFPIVHSLPTKTKPKRIRILANNGKFYDYLVKGTENLNIDCGVMQLLKVVQSFFKFPTRTYSITPLGKRGGLIQIVPDATPLFTLYKRHLQRNKSLEKTSEMFWRRMNSVGYDDRSSLAALREVYETLCGETSCDLITRELLLSAVTPAQWLLSVQTFTRDCAVGSAIGYLLGIGDRHLDNILVNVTHGKFIHVDFSIIFGKGGNLRVPERVPFRLTQNVQSVLQHPGPYGAFFEVMQDVLSSFHTNKETAKHLVKNIAFGHLYDEESPVDLTRVLISEVDAAVKLFQCRSAQYLLIIEMLRNEIHHSAEDLDISFKVSRRMNRLRRMLVNLNTPLQYITGVLRPNGLHESVVKLVKEKWTELFQTNLELGMEQRVHSANSFLQSLDETEKLLKQLQLVLDDCTVWNLDMLKLQDSNIQIIDMNKVEVLVKYAEMNIQTYNPTSTVRKLLEEATSVDNLAQMYEGWTAWV